GLEPSRCYPQVPETCASTSSATFAGLPRIATRPRPVKRRLARELLHSSNADPRLRRHSPPPGTHAPGFLLGLFGRKTKLDVALGQHDRGLLLAAIDADEAGLVDVLVAHLHLTARDEELARRIRRVCALERDQDASAHPRPSPDLETVGRLVGAGIRDRDFSGGHHRSPRPWRCRPARGLRRPTG